MQLDRDRFVVTFDASKLAEEDLVSTIKTAGFEARVVIDTPAESISVAEDEDLELPEFFVEALSQAKRENKPLVLDFTAEWCLPCQRMLKETFPDPLVAPLLSRCIFLKIDTDQHPEIAKKYGVTGLPDVRLLAPDGTERRRLLDFQSPRSFSEELKKLL